jgi:hypothetical protein
MKRLLSIVVAYLVLAYAPGEAHHEQFHLVFADTGRVACASWRSPATAPGRLNAYEHLRDGTMHAWAYGFVVGAAYTSEDRLPRIEAVGVSDWMDTYCAKRPMARLVDAAAALVDHLASRSSTR